MSSQPPFPPGPEGQGQPSEEELRAAYEAQLKQLRVEDVVVQTIVSLLNLAGRKAGLAPGTEDERDHVQLKLAIDSARALLGFVESDLGPDASQIRDALSQLQMAYVQISGGAPSAAEGGPDQPADQGAPGAQPGSSGGSGPAQSSGRLWVPGQ